MDFLYKEGFSFGFKPAVCLECPGYCCCGKSGRIWVSPEEIRRMSSFLGEITIDFVNTYLISIDNRFSIKEYAVEEFFACVFFDTGEKRCRIYPVRPSQCLQYPFWRFFREHPEIVIQECPGVFRR